MPPSACLCTKKNITHYLEDTKLILCSTCGQQEILFLPLKHKKIHIFSPPCITNILFIMRRDWLCNLTLFCVFFLITLDLYSFSQVWSLESGDCQLTLPGDHSSGVSSVTFNDQWVISGDNSGEIKVSTQTVNTQQQIAHKQLTTRFWATHITVLNCYLVWCLRESATSNLFLIHTGNLMWKTINRVETIDRLTNPKPVYR